MDRKIVSKRRVGDHTIFVGEVEEIDFYGGSPLVFYQGRFTDISLP